jgi:transcriptional regulator with XRE-family HTH domain
MSPDELREARRRLGLTQEELARRLRLGKEGNHTVSQWERGRNRRGVPHLVAEAVRRMLKEAEKITPE